MVSAKKQRRSELGAETIQLAFAVPVLLVTFMGILQLCIMAFFTLTLNSEAEQAAWSVDLESISESDAEERNALVKQAIVESSAVIDAQRLSVENSTFKTSEPYSYEQMTPISNSDNALVDKNSGFSYSLSEMYRSVAAGLVEFDVSYRLPSIINLPGLSGTTITKHVVRERVLSTKTEVR